jgi:hypothetical protein
MKTLHKKLQMHEKELFFQSCMMAECYTVSKNSLNKKIQEHLGGYMGVPELHINDAYKRTIFVVLLPVSYQNDRFAEVINN